MGQLGTVGRALRWRMSLAALLVLVGALTMTGATQNLPATAAPANFSNQFSAYGPCNGPYVAECYADTDAHNWDCDLGPNMLTAVVDTLYGSWDTTDLEITLNSDCGNGSHNTYVDVYYYHLNVPNGDYALTDCKDTVAGQPTKCDHWHVTFDPDELVLHSAAFLKSVACHETGHTVGLWHQPYTGGSGMVDSDWQCMRSDLNFPTNVGAHNVGHVNWWYA